MRNQSDKFDFISALTVFFTLLILILHQDDYAINIFPAFFQNNFFATLPVGGFIFLSGYKLTVSKSAKSFGRFWTRRLIRIYPLYLITVMLFAKLVHPEASLNNIIVHALGLQILFPDLFGKNFSTLYFIGLLFIYYFIYSITYKYINRIKKYVFIHGMIFLISFTLHKIKPFGFVIFDPTFFQYYLFFMAGILLAIYKRKIRLQITVSNNLRPWRFFAKLFNYLSIGCYPVYLFHRPYWQCIVNLVPENSLLRWGLVVGFGFPLLFLGGVIIQVMYNGAVKRLGLWG